MGCLNYLTLYLYLIKSPVLGIRGSLEIPLPSMVTCTVCTHDDTGCLLPPPPLVLVSVAQWGGWGDHQMFTPGYSGNNSHWGGCVLWSCENKDIQRSAVSQLWSPGFIVVTRPCLFILCEDYSSCFSTERLSTFKTKIPLSVKSDILNPLLAWNAS